MRYPKVALLKLAKLTDEDLTNIQFRRKKRNRLGFAYQLSFVRLHNRFPNQQPLEIDEEILNYVSLQLGISSTLIYTYDNRRKTVAEHQEIIRKYLDLQRFHDTPSVLVEQFIFDQSCQLEQTHALLSLLRDFLRQHSILEPAESTLRRLIQQERQKARDFVFDKIYSFLTEEHQKQLDKLLETNDKPYSELHRLKQAPNRASASTIIKITEKLDIIKSIGILLINLSWLNNNLQRWMNRHVRQATATRLRKLTAKKRYALLVCFLKQHYLDLTDDLVRTYDKVMSQTYNRTQVDLDKQNRKENRSIKTSLATFQTLADTILDDSITDANLRITIYERIGKNDLSNRRDRVKSWLSGKYKDVFTLLTHTRFSFLRQFSPVLLEHLSLEKEDAKDDTIIQAVELLKEMNRAGKRKIEGDVPISFMPKSTQKLVVQKDGRIDKAAWECALLTAVKDSIKSGNIAIKDSKRYGHIDDFFMPLEQWETKRVSFFERAGLPSDPQQVKGFLTKRLNRAFDDFLEKLPKNKYAQLDQQGWKLSKDESVDLSKDAKEKLSQLQAYLAKNMRLIKLPQLLIEVDNELQFSPHFMSAPQQKKPNTDDVRAVIATVMAHGCNIGSHTMSHLTEGVSYNKIKNISDWFLTQDAQRSALAIIVNAISGLDITKHWGSGKTSSSDGQRFSWRQRILQQSYSPKFRDFALEFYTFIADNYAPYFSRPIECTDRDAPYVLDGLFYNESDLQIEEHYTDTHGYTEINFAAFAMLGKKFSPRIKGVQQQNIYRIDTQKDYGSLDVLVNHKQRKIHLDWIVDNWDRIGHFYASLESGYTTASTALKRLNGYTGKNHFYRANRELGRIFKTEHILKVMSDQPTRSKTTIGLLKSEQLHQLARDLKYAKRGRITSRDWLEQRNSCSSLTLILACIIYWQAKEIHRVLLECPPEKELDLTLLKHVSPITWDNVILYGEYVIDKKWIKL
ncbi:MAG: Tn3 family transposase [Saprospiraceae bacterium]